MRIGGLQKFSLIDYPEKLSCVIFTQGCNFRCPFCHNPELVYPYLFKETIPCEDIFKFLEKRKGQLEGVVITGGEPTIHKDLIGFIEKIKAFGYFIKLDTNGSNPFMLKKIIKCKLVDFIAMDIKAPLEKYNILAGVEVNLDAVLQSIEIIRKSKINYKFRTTYVTSLLDEVDISKIKKMIEDEERYKIQEFIPPRDSTGRLIVDKKLGTN